MVADRQSIMLLAVGIVVALTFPWLIFDRHARVDGSTRVQVAPAAAPRLVDAAKR